MLTNQKRIRHHVITTALAALIGFPTGLLFCVECRSNTELLFRVGFYMSIIWVVLWKGNEFISDFLDRKISWIRLPGKRLTAGLIGHFIYPVVAMFTINYVLYLLYGWNPEIITLQGLINYSLPAVLITFFISTFLTARSFFLAWRQSAINEERMKGEVLSAKFETLKNQVNPHFLFNSLNVLTSLVYKDPDLSAKFIKELSNVYRHVIEVKDMEVVSLKQEIEFLLSFTFLLKMRHSEGLNVNINLTKVDDYNVVPLALQMLVENAVKHNIVSGEEPLNIDIYLENQYIVVHNNLQKKTVRETTSSNVGLINIKARYEYLTDIPVITEESDTDFIVKLPVLSISK